MGIIILIDEAQATLRELISEVAPEDEVVIVENNRPIARLLPSGIHSEANAPHRPRVGGFGFDNYKAMHLQTAAEKKRCQ